MVGYVIHKFTNLSLTSLVWNQGPKIYCCPLAWVTMGTWVPQSEEIDLPGGKAPPPVPAPSGARPEVGALPLFANTLTGVCLRPPGGNQGTPKARLS